MENNGYLDTSVSSNEASNLSKKSPTGDEAGGTDRREIKRENDSMDDFEHLEHEISPNEETSRNADVRNILDTTSAQLIDVPRSQRDERVLVESEDTATRGATSEPVERNILDTSIPADERMLQPVPATPPPSADYEKREGEMGDDAPTEDTRTNRISRESVGSREDFKERPEDDRRAALDYSSQRNEGRMDAKAATLAFMETERGGLNEFPLAEEKPSLPEDTSRKDVVLGAEDRPVREARRSEHTESLDELGAFGRDANKERIEDQKWTVDSGIEDISMIPQRDESGLKSHDFISNIESSVLPVPEKSPEYDFLANENSPTVETKRMSPETRNLMDDDTWNVVERPEAKVLGPSFANGEIDPTRRDREVCNREDEQAPTKPLPPLPKSEIEEEEEEDDDRPVTRSGYPLREHTHDDIYEMSHDYDNAGAAKTVAQQQSGAETGDSEFESAPEQSPAKTSGKTSIETVGQTYRGRKVNEDEDDDIAPKEIFTDMGLDAWFNPERLNPKVAALIYWRQPEKTGIVFGAILGVLLSLAYFSLISVFAYLSLLTLFGTVGFRVYKTFVQAVQKTSDGHPFKDILEVDLTLPAEKVHEVADVAVAHANAAVAELRRLFLVEDFIDSLKFGFFLWCLTYLGSWVNGMTLIIIGVVALFTLPKVYETNMAQIDQNVALVRGKINELTAKVKAAIPIGKKSEPTKEE